MKTRKTYFLNLTLLSFALLVFIGCKQVPNEPAVEDSVVFEYNKEVITDLKPWTNENFKGTDNEFQFVIIGDRTGGHNAQGTFDLAMSQINLLQPEFAINVGDLIEGYPEDKEDLLGMWEEADAMTGKLEMPFFRTIGNHDVSTPLTKEVYLERYGVDYYHFIYKDVLFMVLNSEDGSRPEPPEGIMKGLKEYERLQVEDPVKAKEMLKEFMTDEAVIAALSTPVEFPEKQMDWIKKTLAENADVRWTFLFMHEPCWENPSDSFKAVQQMLKDRDHTFFAGHLHYYDYDKIDGYEHITMGPAGASFHHDGPGNVDHIMWVTMKENGPEMGNIALKGIFDRKGLDTTLFGAYDRKGY